MDAATVLAITGLIDFTTIIDGIGVIGAALALLWLVTRGAGILSKMVRGL